MRLKSTLFSILFMSLAQNSLAVEQTQPKLFAAPGSNQFVVIMNALSNPAISNLTNTNVMVRYYDGTGTHPPCWTEANIAYHSDPNVAGAGGSNACGKPGNTPQGIVKIDIIPLKSKAGMIYEPLLDVAIDPNQFYTTLMLVQDTAPVFNPEGSLKTPGTIKIKKFD